MDRIANHKTSTVTDVYDRHGYADEDKRIMAAVARHVIGLVEGTADEQRGQPAVMRAGRTPVVGALGVRENRRRSLIAPWAGGRAALCRCFLKWNTQSLSNTAIQMSAMNWKSSTQTTTGNLSFQAICRARYQSLLN